MSLKKLGMIVIASMMLNLAGAMAFASSCTMPAGQANVTADKDLADQRTANAQQKLADPTAAKTDFKAGDANGGTPNTAPKKD